MPKQTIDPAPNGTKAVQQTDHAPDQPAAESPDTPVAAVDKATPKSDNQHSAPQVLKPLDNQQLERDGHRSQQRATGQPASGMTHHHRTFLIIGVIAILAGVATGYGGWQLQAQSSGGLSLPGGDKQPTQQVAGNNIKAGDVFGVTDTETFKDTATGYLKIGGLDGEGSHQLLRQGGTSQTVYMTSSITDLDKFAGMQVKVAGETFKAQKAGWLMDVGRVEVLDVEAEPPFVEDE